MSIITGPDSVDVNSVTTYTSDVSSPTKWGASLGSITSSGIFTAPGTAGTSVIIAAKELWSTAGFTSNADNSLTSTSPSGMANLLTKLVNLGDYAIFKVWTGYFSGGILLDFDGVGVYQSGEVYDTGGGGSHGNLAGGFLGTSDFIKVEVAAGNKLKITRNGAASITATRSITAGGATGGPRLTGEPVGTHIDKPVLFFSTGSYQEAVKNVTVLPPVPVSVWSKSGIVPTVGLEAWNALDNATDGTKADDYSGNSRAASLTTLAPVLQRIPAINNQKALYFSGTDNPLTYSGPSFTAKHMFLVGAYDGNLFTGNQGLFNSVVGQTGTVNFHDYGYSNYQYKKNDVGFLSNNQKAPMGKFEIIEIVKTDGLALGGFKIGQDTSDSGTKWKGWFVESLVYSRVLNNAERMKIYRYIALKFHLWRQKLDLLDIFPFNFDRATPISEEDLAEVSEAEGLRGSDRIIRYLDDDPIVTYNLQFEQRRTIELEATRVFNKQHRLHIPWWLIDCEKNDERKLIRTSGLSFKGSEYVETDYNFTAKDY